MANRYLFIFIIVFCSFSRGWAQYPAVENELDKKVKAFLKDNAENWG